ncbi:oxidoreductase [Leifsonia sp. 21MFCrub1.1]|uniref:oxidoreductase n=1 Tax=Leifsonia sp. 21MFCrub1.1 TaxID=1798223 RepID=UPI0008929EF4|nr:oxidoreductase [Leifsonia sp. 21MFCrub1.1]SEB07710.1 ketopantoate reductase [Leifsonia sp. 21MFCrub1.1]
MQAVDGPSSFTGSVAVIGPGAIGTTIAAALHEAGRTPRLYGRTAREQLTLHREGQDIVVPGPVITDASQVGQPADLVFLATKTTQLAAAASWLDVVAGPRTVVCVLQNGIEQQASLAGRIHESRVVPAVVWFPAETQPDGTVLLRGEARLTLPGSPAATTVVQALRETWCGVETSRDFTSVAWRKLLQNAVAGLMVLTGRRAGMYRREDIASLALSYLRECLSVARADGAELDDRVPLEILTRLQAFPVDMGTSILADREAGRPLEWDTRNGVVQRLGRRHGIPTPISDVIVPLLAAAGDGSD